MPPYLPIRALNRSAAIRINKQKVVPGVTTYIDLGASGVAKEFASHSTHSQVYVVGSLSATNVDVVVATGGVVTAGTGLSINTSAGEMKTRSTGAFVAGLSSTNTALADPTGVGQSIVYQIVWDNITGAVSAVAGVSATTGQQVAPATAAGKTPLANVTFAHSAVAPGTITDVRPRA